MNDNPPDQDPTTPSDPPTPPSTPPPTEPPTQPPTEPPTTPPTQPPTQPPTAPPAGPPTPPSATQQPLPRMPPPPPGDEPSAPPVSGRAAIWGGVGVGCGAYVLFGGLLAVLMGAGVISGLLSLVIYFLVPAVVGAVMLAFAPTQRWGIGVLIAASATWLIIIGPCLGLLSGLSGPL